MSSRYKSEVMMKVQAQGSAAGTYEANRQNMPGINEENDSPAGSPSGRAPRRGERAGKGKGGLWPPGFHPLPFQALRASFPEGKPTHVRFEAHVGLIDERISGQMTLSVRTSPPEVRGAPRSGGGMSSRYKSKMMIKVQAQGSVQGTYEAD